MKIHYQNGRRRRYREKEQVEVLALTWLKSEKETWLDLYLKENEIDGNSAVDFTTATIAARVVE